MRISPADGLSIADVTSTARPASPGTAAPADFSEALVRAGAAALEPESAASAAVQRFVAGTEGNLHDTLLAVDKAEISFKFMVGVRNRLVEAYREIMRMGM